MAIETIRLLACEGPNIFSPQPGVALLAQASRDISAPLRNAIKDLGQQIGMVVASLEIEITNTPPAFFHRAWFATPTPRLGRAVVQYILEGFNARATNDSTWDEDEQLEQLHNQRAAEAMPFAMIQLVAEATQRGVPWFRQPNGMLQIGYGSRSHALELADLPFEQRRDGTHLVQSLPWERTGTIPIIACSSTIDTERISHALNVSLPEQHIATLTHANFEAVRNLLAQPYVDLAVLGLEPGSLLAHGLPFDRCLISVLGTPPEQLAQARDTAEIQHVVALPLLVSTGQVLIQADAAALHSLSEYATCPVSLVEAEEIAQAAVRYALQLISP